MKEKPVTEALARRFLLGQVEDLAQQEIESLFISDPEVKNTVLLAEEDLVEDYLDGNLTESDADEFLLRYGHTPHQRRKLRIAESIKQYALAESLPDQPALSAVQRFHGLALFRALRKRGFFIPVAVSVTIILLVTGIWLVQMHNLRTQENNLGLLIGQELTELNSRSSLGETPPQLSSMTLPPVALRGVQPSSELKLQANYPIVELKLLWPQKEEYWSYEATLRRVGSPRRFTVPGLQLEKNSGRNVVRLRLPAAHLVAGLYQISLSGIASDGTSGPTEEFIFSVGR
jgi:hypothetical protein